MATPPLTYAARNKIAVTPLLLPAAPTGWLISTDKPIFEPLVKAALGNLGTSKDGWDPVYDALLAAEGEHTTQLAAMAKNVTAAQFTPGAVRKANYDPIGKAIEDLTPVGDAQLAAYNAGVGGQPSPSGGGGGGTPAPGPRGGGPPAGGGGAPGGGTLPPGGPGQGGYPQSGQCPPGYYFDDTVGTCVPYEGSGGGHNGRVPPSDIEVRAATATLVDVIRGIARPRTIAAVKGKAK